MTSAWSIDVIWAEIFRFEKHRIMNPGSGASNVDLSEAERLLKQSTAAPGLPNPAVPPHFMLMHQAVAMQQFQFQQALLLQQVSLLFWKDMP